MIDVAASIPLGIFTKSLVLLPCEYASDRPDTLHDICNRRGYHGLKLRFRRARHVDQQALSCGDDNEHFAKWIRDVHVGSLDMTLLDDYLVGQLKFRKVKMTQQHWFD